MSTVNQSLNNGQQAITNYDLSKIFVLNNRYQNNNYVNNSGYDPISLPVGTVMGRIHATGVLAPWNGVASDGTQFPVGILAQQLDLADSETQLASICDMGDVAEEKVSVFYAGQSLETVVSNRRLRDHLQAQGIKLVAATEMTAYDNQ